MKIYEIKVAFSFFVAANTPEEAYAVGGKHNADAMKDEPTCVLRPIEVTSIDQVPEVWRKCLPFVLNDEREELTIEEHLIPSFRKS